MSKFCTHCGAPRDHKALFCGECGQAGDPSSPAAAAPTVPDRGPDPRPRLSDLLPKNNNGTLDNLAEGCGCGAVSALLGLLAVAALLSYIWDGIKGIFS